MSSDPKPRSTLAAAFGVDADELGGPALNEPTPPPDPDLVDDDEDDAVLESLPDISYEVEPGVVRYGNMDFIKNGDSLIPLSANVQVNLTFTAIERHRLKRFADEHRMSMVEVVREALKTYMAKKKKK